MCAMNFVGSNFHRKKKRNKVRKKERESKGGWRVEGRQKLNEFVLFVIFV